MIVLGHKTSNTGFARIVQLTTRHGWSFFKHATVTKVLNLLNNYGERLIGRCHLSSFPVEIQIDPTNICDLKCPLCPTGLKSAVRKPGMMDYELLKKIIDELGKYLFKIRLYNWGEPFLNKNIFTMIQYAALNNIGTEISSNLVSFDKNRAEEVVRCGLEYLIISVDGADEMTYGMYRIGGKFQSVIENIRAVVQTKQRLQSLTPIIEIQFLVMKHNEHTMELMCKLARSLDVDLLRFGPVTVNIRNNDDLKWLPDNNKLSRYDIDSRIDKLYKTRKRCEMLWRTSVINWDGSVSPCCVYEGDKCEVGSIRNQSFRNIWNNHYYIACRAMFSNDMKSRSEINTICKSCKGIPYALDKKQNGLY